jgi:5'(3')-deoxyribonucleotidase
VKKTILIDIDDTVIDMHNPWSLWYKEQTGQELLVQHDQFAFDISITHIDPLMYWVNPELYDDREPWSGAVDFVNKYKDTHNIIFCSWCFVEHKKSKENFIKKHFGDYPFIDTKYKEYIKCDYMIDDKLFFLDNSARHNYDSRILIHFNNGLNYKESPYEYMNWEELIENLGEM